MARKIKYVTPRGNTLRLLHSLGISRICPIFTAADVEETGGGNALKTATENARIKGEWAAARTDKPVFAFDTVVGLDGAVYGKPKTQDEAVGMFKTLCGRTHEVITAVYYRDKSKIIQKSEKTLVTFGAFDDELVYNYVRSGAPFDKAGGYNIDDEAIGAIVTGIKGEYDNVVGLPVGLTEKLIEENIIYGENGYSR